MTHPPEFAPDSEIAALSLSLYEAVLDGRGLLAAVAPLAALIGATSHSIHQTRYRDGRPVGSVVAGQGGCSAEAREEYARVWVRHCPRAHALGAVDPARAGLTDLGPIEAWRDSRVWQRWGRPKGAGFHLLALPLQRAANSLAGILFNRREDEPPFGARERAVLQAAMAPLRRAYGAETRLAAARLGPEEAPWRGLEAMPDGIALLDADRRLVFANAALRRMAAGDAGFRLCEGVGLDLTDPAQRVALARAVTAALAAAEGRIGLLESAGSLALPRPGGRPPLLIRALPVVPGEVGAGFRGAMLLVADGARRARPSAALLGRMFGLTPAEASLAATLAAGRTVAEHAKRRGISVETARSQMAAVRRKTGCHRQAELAALLARLPG